MARGGWRPIITGWHVAPWGGETWTPAPQCSWVRPLGGCRTLHWEIGHPAWALGQMEHPETWSGQIFTCPSLCLSFPLCGEEKRDL